MNRNFYCAVFDSLEIKSRLLVILAQAVNQLIACRDPLYEWVLRHRRGIVAIHFGGRLRKVYKGLHQGALGLVNLVKHEDNLLNN